MLGSFDLGTNLGNFPVVPPLVIDLFQQFLVSTTLGDKKFKGFLLASLFKQPFSPLLPQTLTANLGIGINSLRRGGNS